MHFRSLDHSPVAPFLSQYWKALGCTTGLGSFCLSVWPSSKRIHKAMPQHVFLLCKLRLAPMTMAGIHFLPRAKFCCSRYTISPVEHLVGSQIKLPPAVCFEGRPAASTDVAKRSPVLVLESSFCYRFTGRNCAV